MKFGPIFRRVYIFSNFTPILFASIVKCANMKFATRNELFRKKKKLSETEVPDSNPAPPTMIPGALQDHCGKDSKLGKKGQNITF